MTSPASKTPMNWEDYEYGRSASQGSIGSTTSRDLTTRPSPPIRIPGQDGGQGPEDNDLRRRRSSISMRINSIRYAGGVNSIDNFARSWQRAVGFHEITPARSSFVITESDEAEDGDRPRDEEEGPKHHRSLLRQHLEQSGAPSDAAIEEEDGEDNARIPERPAEQRFPSEGINDIFSLAPHLASPLSRSYGTSYGTLSSRINDSAKRHAAKLYKEQQLAGAQEPDKEREPLLVKQIQREDGTKANIVVGQSTLPQTVFNSVNVLIGVGLLSLPLGIKSAGWALGMGFLLFSAIVTSYTARILAVCLDVDQSLITYADIAFISFGARARVVTGFLFSLELIAACVALVVLFADSLDALIPGWSVLEWKILCGIILIPLNFAPLRLLSLSSVLGILCCTMLVGIVFIDGFIKPHSPGSLREPAKTYLFPDNWMTLPLSFGLLMSPWGGHSVFPNIYRDMRHPRKYNKGLKYTYTFTYLLDLAMAVGGLLMFGDTVRDEITSNILLTKGYPRALSILIVVLIAIMPVTKVPLSCRPIISTVEIIVGLDPRAISPSSRLHGLSGFTRGVLKCSVRILVIVLILLIAIVFPSFDSIMALMGSCLCFTICVTLPLSFYLKIFGKEISLRERILDWFLIVICTIMAIIGTVWAFLPKRMVGGK